MARLPALVLVYLICLPLAIFSGYLLATPLSYGSLGLLGVVLGGLALPLFMKWHHAMLIFAWNSYLIIFFFPSQPSLALGLSVGSLFMSVLARTMDKSRRFISVPSLTAPMVFLLLVVLATIALTGGVGSRIFGSESYGGRRYFTIIGAILGYFALTAQSIPAKHRNLMASLFFLSGLTDVISDVAYALGPNFYFLFTLVSANLAAAQAITQDTLMRFSGLSFAGLAFCFFLLIRFGIAGTFSHPVRLFLFMGATLASLFGGYRASMLVLLLVFATQFYYEGLLRTKYAFILIALTLFTGIFVVVMIDRMPLSVQRSLSFLPLKIDQTARLDAEGTLDWRLQIWKTVLPDVPKYLLVGKGYNFNATDYFLTQEAVRHGGAAAYEDTLISGNYHNGILTIIIPLGAAGMIAFIWLMWAGYRVLRRNYLYGPPELKQINTFLMAYFVARLLFYVGLYGQFDLDLQLLVGILGLSVSMNNGVASPRTETVPQPIPAARSRLAFA